jgi:hypothetical protein
MSARCALGTISVDPDTGFEYEELHCGCAQCEPSTNQGRWEEDHWDYIEQIGARDDYISDVVYEDADQRLGGNDSPYPED